MLALQQTQSMVQQVIVAEADFFDTFIDTSPGKWVETFKDGSNLIGGAGGSGIVIVKETAAGNSGIYNMDDVYAYSIDNKW